MTEEFHLRKRPNIFQFATSELSQDAFICWLLSWGTPEYATIEPTLADCARRLVREFLRRSASSSCNCAERKPQEQRIIKGLSGVDVDNILSIDPPVRQYAHIEVYFQTVVKVAGSERRLSVIIEDKTHTSHHSGQLERYLDQVRDDEEVQGDGRKEDAVIGIYFKTGFIYDEDKEDNLPSPYVLFTREDFLGILRETDSSDSVFLDFRNYLDAMDRGFKQDLSGIWDDIHSWKWEDPESGRKRRPALAEPHAQWDFFDRLFRSEDCPPETIGEARMLRGTNSGEPWTQFVFAQFTLPASLHEENLCYRLDFRKHKGDWLPHIALKAYSRFEDNGQKDPYKARQAVRRRRRLCEIFEQTYLSAKENCGLTIRRADPSVDRSGNYETEIGIFFIGGKSGNTTQQMQKDLPIFHSRLLPVLEQFYSTEASLCLAEFETELTERIGQVMEEFFPGTKMEKRKTWTNFEKQNDLVCITFGNSLWQRHFRPGSEACEDLGVVVMVDDWYKEARISVRTLLNKSLTPTQRQKFRDACDEPIHIREIGDWLKVFEKKKWPSHVLKELDLEAVVSAVAGELCRLKRVFDKLSACP